MEEMEHLEDSLSLGLKHIKIKQINHKDRPENMDLRKPRSTSALASGEVSPESPATMYSSSESWSMAQDFLNSGSPPCDSHSPGHIPSHRRAGSYRMHRHRKNYIIQEDWDIGDVRPRVFSMPTRPSYLNKRQLYVDNGEEMSKIRSFTISPKGLVSEGNSLLRKSATNGTSNSSLDQPGSSRTSLQTQVTHRVGVLGSGGVGKSALIHAFTQDKDSDVDVSFDDESEKTVSILLDGEESTMEFVDLSNKQVDAQLKCEQMSAYVVVYSVEDRRSYEASINRLLEIREEIGDQVALILVANKTDLVRTREVSEEEGRAAAQTYNSKYIEVSAAIDLKVDELLVGVLKQIRLFKQKYDKCKARLGSTLLDNCCLLQSRENVISKIFKGGKPQSKSCDNLYVL